MSPEDPPRSPDEEAEGRRIAELKAFIENYDNRLRKCFNAPDFAERVDAVMNAQGRMKKHPKAGETF